MSTPIHPNTFWRGIWTPKTCPKKTKLEHVFGRPGYMTPFLGCFFSAVQTLATHFGFRRCVFRKTPRDVLLFKVLANEAPQGDKLGHDLKVLRKKPSKRVADLAPEARPKTLVKHQHLDPDLYHLSADMCPAKLFWGDKSAVFLPVGDMELINGELCFSYHGNPMVHWWMNSEGIRTRNSRQHGAYSQLMVDWWFGARWFGIRFGIFPSGFQNIQSTGPQTTVYWSLWSTPHPQSWQIKVYGDPLLSVKFCLFTGWGKRSNSWFSDLSKKMGGQKGRLIHLKCGNNWDTPRQSPILGSMLGAILVFEGVVNTVWTVFKTLATYWLVNRYP